VKSQTEVIENLNKEILRNFVDHIVLKIDDNAEQHLLLKVRGKY
jgi:hypothetical protein